MNISVAPQSGAMSSAEEATFTAPEGIFSLSDEVKPPVLHTQNPSTPNLYPCRLTTITVTFPAKQTSQGFAALLRRHKDGSEDKDKDKEGDKKDEKEGEETSLSDTDNPESEGENGNGEPAGLFSPTEPAAGKKKSNARATHNIRSTSSSFVTRIHTVEGLNKHLSTKQGDITFVFYNGAKSFFWYELGGMKEPLARVTFSAFPTCHDINRTTSTYDNLDLLIGFNTGDIMWFDPLSSRYVRINKQGSMTLSPVTCVRWVPGHKSMFLASHADGTMMVYDKEREDGQFESSDATRSESELQSDDRTPGWNPLEEMLVTRPQLPATPGVGSKNEKPLKNPVSHWKVCRRPITDFQFSPDMKHLIAVSSEDGCLRIIDSRAEKLLDTYSSYFGSLSCLAWTPDSRYVLTAGQDDLISIVSLREQRVVARCQGHTSFVVSVSVDLVQTDSRVYRFGSLGEDKQLALWDFTAPPNRARAQTVTRSLSAPLLFGAHMNDRQPASTEQTNSRYHPAQPRSVVAIIYPSMLTRLDGDIPSSLTFSPSCLVTATRPGFIKTWTRPTPRDMDITAAQNALFGRSPDTNKDVTAAA